MNPTVNSTYLMNKLFDLSVGFRHAWLVIYQYCPIAIQQLISAILLIKVSQNISMLDFHIGNRNIYLFPLLQSITSRNYWSILTYIVF